MFSEPPPPFSGMLYPPLDVKSCWGVSKRYVCGIGGVLFVVLAFVGVFLPGIPTTGPLIAASFLLAKSHPALEKRLVRNRWFAKYLSYLDGHQPMPLRARVWALGWMWLSISLSSIYLSWTLAQPHLVVTVIVASGLVGTVVIVRFRRVHVESHAKVEDCSLNAWRGSSEDQAEDVLVALFELQEMATSRDKARRECEPSR